MAAAHEEQTEGPSFTGIRRGSDGETITAFFEGGTANRIRLLGIDAPEIHHGNRPDQPFGEETRGRLDHRTEGKTVPLDAYGLDRYHRVLAMVWHDQVNVNVLMVVMGYAEVYGGGPCQAYCRELEQADAKAKQDRVGMWAQGEKYESPRDFRKRMRR